MLVRAGLLLLLMWLAVAADAGEYFLDGAQRRELLREGYITGRDGARYNVWIVPGYAEPWAQVGKGWRAAGEDLKAYGRPDYWPDMIDTTRAVMRFARRDVLRDFAWEGSARAWRESSAAAQRRTQRRVFGWWLAWPWAVVEGGTEALVRVGAGVPGGAALWAGGAAGTPATYLIWPVALGAGHAFGQGVLLPLGGAGWNTLVAPPLALAGQQPAPERADGWWMKRMADPAEDDIRARLDAWHGQWATADELVTRRRDSEAAGLAHEARLRELAEQMKAETRAWEQGGKGGAQAYQEALLAQALAALPTLRAELDGQGYSLPRLQAMRAELEAELVSLGLERAGAMRVVDAWLGPPDTPRRLEPPPAKTDPLQEVIRRAPAAAGEIP